MHLFCWNPRLALGVDEIDTDHRAILDAMADLRRVDGSAASHPALELVFRRLLELTEQHFADEADLMVRIGYPGVAEYARMHDEMVAELEGHYRTFLTGDRRAIAEALRFLVYWWTAHIRGIDQDYVDFARRHPS